MFSKFYFYSAHLDLGTAIGYASGVVSCGFFERPDDVLHSITKAKMMQFGIGYYDVNYIRFERVR